MIEAARACRAHERFQLRERLLNRIEIGTVGRQELQVGAGRLDPRLYLRVFVDGQVVEDDYIAGLEGRRQDLVDVGKETGLIDGAVEDGRRDRPVEPQPQHHRARLPMPERRVIPEAHPTRAAPVPPNQIRRDAALVEKDVAAHIAQWLPVLPPPSRGRDVRPTLLVGVYGFF